MLLFYQFVLDLIHFIFVVVVVIFGDLEILGCDGTVTRVCGPCDFCFHPSHKNHQFKHFQQK